MTVDSPLYSAHLTSATSLVTPYENTRAGFVQMVLEKNERATPAVAEARDLAIEAKKAGHAAELLKNDGIRGALLTAAGISNKARNHIDHEGQNEAIENLVQGFLEPAGTSFREELVYRFLLTRGDALGGSLRNLIGALAQRRFSTMLVARFANAGMEFEYFQDAKEDWERYTGKVPPPLENIRGFAWSNTNGERLLRYNLTIRPLVDKNVDMTLFSSSPSRLAEVRKDPAAYLALGELKGGIDPAGADEHWKTANSALDRIRVNFLELGCEPNLFFVGAAIEAAMAKEIWEMLVSGKLTNAANLTVDEHLTSLCDWLVNV